MSRHSAPTRSNNTFACSHCGATVTPPEAGTAQRNHCPRCLWSAHVDVRIGDRLCACKGAMEPVGVWTKDNGEWAIIHRCTKCGFFRANRVSGDDDEIRLFALAAKPLANLPFPYRSIDQRIDRSYERRIDGYEPSNRQR